ncbi:MAG: Uma2 family endonuclease [Bryobacterales bacterium]|nr:Uma2 family endonuclease [Bryobacterales bacterium]
MGVLPVSRLTEAEYFAADDASELPLEYVDGEVFPMEAATNEHASLTWRLATMLEPRLHGKPCLGMVQPKVKIGAGRYLYPDLAVVCGEASVPRGAFTETPQVIFEILSPSTEGFDRGAKFGFYRALASLEQYVLVSQDAPHVDVFTRGQEGAWVMFPMMVFLPWSGSIRSASRCRWPNSTAASSDSVCPSSNWPAPAPRYDLRSAGPPT